MTTTPNKPLEPTRASRLGLPGKPQVCLRFLPAWLSFCPLGVIMRKTTIMLLVALAVCAWLAWAAFQPTPGRPNVSITILGYTNDPSGRRLAMITVTNLSASKIYIYNPTIKIMTEPHGFTKSHRFNAKLIEGASGSFTIPSPTNQSPWKLSFFVYNDFGVGHFLQNMWRGRQHPYDIESDWFDVKQ